METETYIGSRLIILFIGVILSWYGAYYILPNYIREDGFGFVEQVDVFFSLSFFFSMLFLIYTLCEIQKFKKTRNIKLKNDYGFYICPHKIHAMNASVKSRPLTKRFTQTPPSGAGELCRYV